MARVRSLVELKDLLIDDFEAGFRVVSDMQDSNIYKIHDYSSIRDRILNMYDVNVDDILIGWRSVHQILHDTFEKQLPDLNMTEWELYTMIICMFMYIDTKTLCDLIVDVASCIPEITEIDIDEWNKWVNGHNVSDRNVHRALHKRIFSTTSQTKEFDVPERLHDCMRREPFLHPRIRSNVMSVYTSMINQGLKPQNVMDVLIAFMEIYED